MREEIAEHPLTKPFWKQSAKRSERNNSSTLDDLDYTIRLDEESVELEEERTSYDYSSKEIAGTLRGRWEPLRITHENVALRLSGEDRNGAAVDKVLVLWDDDIDYCDLDWWARASQNMDQQTVTIEPAEAAARGLPPLRIRVCYARLPFVAEPLPDPQTYASFTFSPPPSGRAFLGIHPLPPEVRDAVSLEALVRRRSAAEPGFALAGCGVLDFRGQACLAQLHFSGLESAVTAVCSLAVPGGGAGVLLVFGHDVKPDAIFPVRTVAESVPIARLLKRLTWEPPEP